MISFPNSQQQYMQPTYNNFGPNIYQQQQSNTNTTNIFNNFNFGSSTPQMQQQQPMMMQQQMMFPQMQQQQPMMMQQQMMIPQMQQQPMMMQQQMMFPQMQQQPMMMQQQQMMIPQQQQQRPQQNSSSGFMQQLITMLLPMLLGNNQGQTEAAKKTAEQTTVVDSLEWGDPHFEATGADGKTKIKFDHKGEKDHTYNVFQGDGYEVDAKYADWSDPKNPRIMTQTRIQAGADTIEFTKDGKSTINGQVIKDGSTVKLNDGTKVNVKAGAMTIESRDGDGAKINLTSQSGYINVSQAGKFSNLGGIMGTAIAKNKGLTEEEANKFDVTNTNKKIA